MLHQKNIYSRISFNQSLSSIIAYDYPCGTAKKSKLFTITHGENPRHCLKTWLLSSSVFRHRGHELSEATLLNLRFFRAGIKFQEIHQIVMAIFFGRCKFHSFL